MDMMTIVKALERVRPGAHWVLSTENLSGLVWLDNTTPPTAEELGLI